ncbi:MAG: 50S ribosomal protein L24 [Verrucomicrobiota bacterium]|nr:50S ribosomal protein L24 [Verrucomicrobiota bacterium]|tara:strand:- start:396 stop:617 length:222 start_codon:yes stop_codon:yes gene_type:complete
MATKLRKGDEVVVITGDDKGSKGKILQVIREKNRVLVEGINISKKHERKTQDNPQGAIVEREAPIHYSNVKKV